MNSKTAIHLLLLFSLFVHCLPAPKHLLVETDPGNADEVKAEQEDGEEVDYSAIVLEYYGQDPCPDIWSMDTILIE